MKIIDHDGDGGTYLHTVSEEEMIGIREMQKEFNFHIENLVKMLFVNCKNHYLTKIYTDAMILMCRAYDRSFGDIGFFSEAVFTRPDFRKIVEHLDFDLPKNKIVGAAGMNGDYCFNNEKNT